MASEQPETRVSRRRSGRAAGQPGGNPAAPPRPNAGELVAGLAGQVLVSACLGRIWQRRSGKTGIDQDHPLPRTSVARPVCHQCCCHDHHQDDHGGGGGVRPWSPGRADPGQVPFELVDAVLAETRAAGAAAAAAAVAGGGVFRAGAGLVPAAGLPGRVGEADRGAGRAGRWRARRRRRCGTCAGVWARAAAGAVRDAGRAGGAAAHARGAVRRGTGRSSFDGCNSVKVPDTARNRAWLGKQAPSNGETGYPAIALMTLVETGTRALLGAVFGPARPGRPGSAGSCCPCWTAACWC